MDSTISRSFSLSVAACVALFMAAAARDSAFAVHMMIFAGAGILAAFATANGLGFLKPSARDLASRYDDQLIRIGVILTVFWGVVGFLVGLVIAAQLAFPLLNLNFEWTTFGRSWTPWDQSEPRSSATPRAGTCVSSLLRPIPIEQTG